MSDSFNPYHKWLGIPLREQPANLYRLLGIELLEGDADVIENAADQRMRHVRSFQTGPHKALSQALLNEIAAARVRLLDPVQKKAYDATLAAPAAAPPALHVPPQPVPVAPVPVAPVPIPPIQSAPIQPAPIARVQPVAVAPQTAPSAPIPPTIRTPSRAARSRPAQSNAYQFIIVTALVAAGVVLAGVVFANLGVNSNDTRQAQAPPVTANPVAPDPAATKNTTTKQSTPPVVKPAVVQPTATPASASKLPPLAGETRHQPFTWKRGDKPVEMGMSRDHFVVTSWFSGHFLGNGEWYDVDEQKGVNWLRGGGVQDLGATVTQVQSPYRAWFEDKVQLVRWKKGQPPVKLIHERDGFAVLCGASGCFLGPEHRVEVKLNRTDGNWYLSGTTNFDTKANALVYRFKEPGKLRAEVEEVPWNGGTHWEKKMISVQEGLCAISSISGAYRGWGENLNCVVKDDGHWHIWGYTKTNSTAGTFTSIRLKTPAMLALPTNAAAANVGILKVFPGHTTAAISIDSRFMATADKEGVLHLWNLPRRSEIREFKGHQGTVVGVKFSPDGTQLYSMGEDQTARIWNVSTGAEIRSFPLGQKPSRMHLTADCQKWFLLTGTAAFAYDVASGKMLKEWQLGGNQVSISALSADGRHAIISGQNNTVRVCDLETGKHVPLEHAKHCYSSTLSADASVAVAGGGDSLVRVWHVATQHPVAEFPVEGHVYGVALSRDGKRVLGFNSNNRIHLWNSKAGEKPQVFDCPFGANVCGFSADGRYVHASGPHGALLLGIPE